MYTVVRAVYEYVFTMLPLGDPNHPKEDFGMKNKQTHPKCLAKAASIFTTPLSFN